MSDEPEFKPTRTIGDYVTKEGAEKLKARIEDYWRNRGYIPPTVGLLSQGFVPQIREARYDLRSDMVGGLPRARQ